MRRRDRAVIVVLVLALGALAAAIGIQSNPEPVVVASPSPTITPVRPYVEGVVGRATSVSPLSARNEVDRALVALVFSGLLRNGPEGTLVGDLADQWTFEADGSSATFHLRENVLWHDGEPVTADDVAFTVRTLQDPEYTGPGAGSWREVSVTVLDAQSIRFDLATPLGGFLEAATQPIIPAHLLEAIPVAQLADPGFGQAPIGSGPFRLVSLDEAEAVLEPAAFAQVGGGAAGSPGIPGSPGIVGSPDPNEGSASSDAPPKTDQRVPYLAGMTFQFFETSADLAEAYAGAGGLDAASGLTVEDATRLGAAPDSTILAYPTTTLTALIVNLRGDQTLFRDAAVRRALLAGVDRAALVAGPMGGFGVVADAPIPPSSWAFDAASTTPVAFDPAALASGLKGAGWELIDGFWRPGDGEGPLTLQLLYPDVAAGTVDAAAAQVAADWTAAGLQTEAFAVPAGEFAGVRLREGDFDAAFVSVSVGLDPDLYPLLASTQATRGGTNFSGIQDAALDKLLQAARAPGTDEQRRAAYAALQVRLAEQQYLLPLAFREAVVVVRNTLSGAAIRTLGDPGDRFWDVLTWRLAYDR